MWGKMPCVVDPVKCFLHDLTEICLFWYQCSPKWLEPVCSPSVQSQSSSARGRGARLCCGHQQGSGGTEPSQPAQLSSSLWGSWWFPHCSVKLEIPPVVLGSSVCSLAVAVSLFCFWFLLWPVCLGFAACIWSLLQILLVAPGIPNPCLVFPAFLLTLWLCILGFLAHSCLKSWLRQTLFFWSLGLGRGRSLCVSALDSKLSLSLALTCRLWLPRAACQSYILSKVTGFMCGDIKKRCVCLKLILSLFSWTHNNVHPWLRLCCCLAWSLWIKPGLCVPNTANPAALTNTHISCWSGSAVV